MQQGRGGPHHVSRPDTSGVGPEGVAAALHARDPSAEAFGIVLVSAEPGHVVVEMRVAPWMCNGLGTCHGGVVFTLADSAMAFASNGHGETAFAVAASVDLLAPATEGTRLRATATERWLQGRTGMYDVTVTAHADDRPADDGSDGAVVAMFRGRVRRVGRPVLDTETGDAR